jgi:hypothetical protein
MRADPNCERCGKVETMEHLLCKCMHYSQLLRVREVITQHLNRVSPEDIPRIEISQLNVIYNVPHPSLLLDIPNKLIRNALLILTQEIKHDINYRHMNLLPMLRQVTSSQRLTAHLVSTMHRLHSYFQYISSAKFVKAISALQMMEELNLELP